ALPLSTLFPYTTLFRSRSVQPRVCACSILVEHDTKDDHESPHRLRCVLYAHELSLRIPRRGVQKAARIGFRRLWSPGGQMQRQNEPTRRGLETGQIL